MVALGTLAGAAAWLAWWWPRSPGLALAGALLGLCWPGLHLGLQMLLMRRVVRKAGAPVPSWRAVAEAWLAEWRGGAARAGRAAFVRPPGRASPVNRLRAS